MTDRGTSAAGSIAQQRLERAQSRLSLSKAAAEAKAAASNMRRASSSIFANPANSGEEAAPEVEVIDNKVNANRLSFSMIRGGGNKERRKSEEVEMVEPIKEVSPRQAALAAATDKWSALWKGGGERCHPNRLP